MCYSKLFPTCKIGENVVIKENVFIGEHVVIEDNVYIDYNCIIRDHTHIKKNSVIGANCVLGEYSQEFFTSRTMGVHPLIIGESSFIRSGTILYGDTTIGDHFQTGHRVTIREHTRIGHHASIGTLSDLQGYCTLGNYVRAHSNVHIGQKTDIHDYVFIFPYTVFTNDPTPPSTDLIGVTVESFAIIAVGALIMPGKIIHSDSLVGAGAVVTKDVESMTVVAGNPAKKICDITDIKNKQTNESIYPWRNTFERGLPWEGIGYEAWDKLEK